MGNIAIPSSGRTHLVLISRANSNGAYIQITDMHNNITQRLSSGNGSTITIGGITYTGQGKSSTDRPKVSMSKNGTIYAPVKLAAQPTQPTKATYNSGTVLTLGTDDAPESNVYLFSPN